jgi:hypothetical protein
MAPLGSGFETRSLSRLAIAALTAGSPTAWTRPASTPASGVGSARHTCGSAAASASPPRTWSRPRPAKTASFVRAREGHLERLSQELDTARPEMIITLGNAALRVLRLLVEIDSGDPGPGLAETSYGAEVRARLGARPVRWLPLVHPRSGERIPKWRQIHMRWVERTHDRLRP